MNSNEKIGDERRLDGVLREWHIATPLPPRFREQVWERVSLTKTRGETSFLTNLVKLIEVVLPRPRVAFSFVATLCVVGIAAGSITAQVRTSQLNATLGERYVQSVDPYHPATPHP
jgi:hypothetical protein